MALTNLVALPAKIDQDSTRRDRFAHLDLGLDIAVLVVGRSPVPGNQSAFDCINRVQFQQRLADVVKLKNLFRGTPR